MIKGLLIRSLSESVESSSLSLERVNNVHSSDGLSLGMLGVSDGILDDGSEEFLEDVSDFLVDSEGDSLDTSSSGESSDGWLGDTLDDWSGSTSSSDSLLGMNFSVSFSAFSSFRSHDKDQL